MSTGVQSKSSVRAGDHPVVRSAVILRETLRLPTMLTMLSRDFGKVVTTTPDKRTESDAEAPIKIINDLTKGAGTQVDVTMHHDIQGYPIMGKKNAEGKGEERTGSRDELKIDRTTKVVDDGDVFDFQERGYKMKNFNRSDLGKYFRQLQDQRITFHLAGARGHYTAKDIKVPLEGHPLYHEVMVNKVQAPTARGVDDASTRQFYAGGKDSYAGAKPLTGADTLTADDIRDWKRRVQEMPNPPELIDLSPEDDPYAYDPMYVLCVSPRAYQDLAADLTTSGFETMRSNAIARAGIYAGGRKKVHPVFRGDCVLIDDVLVRKTPIPIRFVPGKDIIVDDPTSKAYSATTTQIQGAGFAVERCLWLGGEAMAMAFGNTMAGAKRPPGTNMMGRNFNFLEAFDNFGRSSETAIDWVDGCKKLTFTDSEGVDVDRGVIACDVAVRLN